MADERPDVPAADPECSRRDVLRLGTAAAIAAGLAVSAAQGTALAAPAAGGKAKGVAAAHFRVRLDGAEIPLVQGAAFEPQEFSNIESPEDLETVYWPAGADPLLVVVSVSQHDPTLDRWFDDVFSGAVGAYPRSLALEALTSNQAAVTRTWRLDVVPLRRCRAATSEGPWSGTEYTLRGRLRAIE